MMREPARRYSWAPFAAGHTLSVFRHGLDSPRTITALADELAAWVVEQYPHLAAYPFAVSDFCHPAARAAITRHFVDGLEDPHSRPDLLKELRADERRTAEAARALGLDPTSHARMVRERAEAGLSVDELERRRTATLEEGRRVRLARESTLAVEAAAVDSAS